MAGYRKLGRTSSQRKALLQQSGDKFVVLTARLSYY